MNNKKIRILIISIISIILLCDVTYTKDNKYTKINNMISVLLINKPLIEKGINIEENEN